MTQQLGVVVNAVSCCAGGSSLNPLFPQSSHPYELCMNRYGWVDVLTHNILLYRCGKGHQGHGSLVHKINKKEAVNQGLNDYISYTED